MCALPLTASAQEIGIFGSPSNPEYNIDVRDFIMCTGEFVFVGMHDTSFSTPELQDLTRYHAILVYGDAPHADPEAFGDVIADYIEAGHGVVFGAPSFSASPGMSIGGRAVDYMPVTPTGAIENFELIIINVLPEFQFYQGIPPIAGHPTVYGLDIVTQNMGPIVTGVSLANDGQLIAEWENGHVGIVIRESGDPNIGNTAAVNLFPPSFVVDEDLWIGDGDRMITNSLLWVAGFGKPAGTCYNEDVEQDVNCNTIDVNDEPPIDLGDPQCLDNINPDTDLPYDSNDYYYDYESHGCLFPVKVLLHDPDRDGLSGFDPMAAPPVGVIPIPVIPDDPYSPVWQSGSLTCDNCTYQYNPDQADIDCDDVGDLCDNCPYVANNDQFNGCFEENFGFNPDDYDCFGSACDNCPCINNPDQADVDIDGRGDICDNCIQTFNPDQADTDVDFAGDACDNCPNLENPGQGDVDFDGVGDLCDNCPNTVNPDQIDTDSDGMGDACDNCPLERTDSIDDTDGDGVGDDCDNCPTRDNADQIDTDLDLKGDRCDNCPTFANGDQNDADGDGVGDACDGCPFAADSTQEDLDEDGVGDACDNCADLTNSDQEDQDADGFGDLCDLCPETATDFNIDSDGDGVGDECDNCPNEANPNQENEDGDDLGDACDNLALRGGGSPSQGCSTVPTGTSGFGLLALALIAAGRRRWSFNATENGR